MTMVSDTPLPSATVVLLRDGESALEAYLVKRHGRTSFGNAWAFPGGVVNASDARVHNSCRGIDPEKLDRMLDAPNAANYYSAAIRELFEETGVLLGTAAASAAEIDAARDALNDGRLAWDEFVDSARVALECDRLHYLSYWITPAGLPKRFATRFFLARMPVSEVAHHCGRELIDCRWLTTSDALAEHREGRLSMIFPTVSTLEFLDAFENSEAAIAEANRIAEEGIVPILPKAIDSGGKRVIVLPGDPRYASTAT
jgi:8-oxo-dGTP pyrophosphatase MutT (NUDIX family)